jgi:hypothetical protein
VENDQEEILANLIPVRELSRGSTEEIVVNQKLLSVPAISKMSESYSQDNFESSEQIIKSAEVLL